MLYSYAQLTADQLNAIQSLEKDVGQPLIAMAGQDLDAAPVDQSKLDRIKALEDELGIVLVAVNQS